MFLLKMLLIKIFSTNVLAIIIRNIVILSFIIFLMPLFYSPLKDTYLKMGICILSIILSEAISFAILFSQYTSTSRNYKMYDNVSRKDTIVNTTMFSGLNSSNTD